MRNFLTLWLGILLLVYGVGQVRAAYAELGLVFWGRLAFGALSLALGVLVLT